VRRRRDATSASSELEDEAALAWLRWAAIVLFPTTAERDDDGHWTASTPHGLTMMAVRREIVKLRNLALRGGKPLPLVDQARTFLDARGLLDLVDR
jgi:hypothetical protein